MMDSSGNALNPSRDLLIFTTPQHIPSRPVCTVHSDRSSPRIIMGKSGKLRQIFLFGKKDLLIMLFIEKVVSRAIHIT